MDGVSISLYLSIGFFAALIAIGLFFKISSLLNKKSVEKIKEEEKAEEEKTFSGTLDGLFPGRQKTSYLPYEARTLLRDRGRDKKQKN